MVVNITERGAKMPPDESMVGTFMKNGFVILENVISPEMSDDLVNEALSLVRVQRCANVSVSDYEGLDREGRIDFLLEALFRLERKDHEYIRGLHDALRDCPALLRILSLRRICDAVNALLGRPSGAALFPRPHSVRMDFPADKAFVLDWHQEVHYSPKDANLIQLWAPAVTDITVANGALRVLPGSHLGGIAKTIDTVPEFGHAQYTVEPSHVAQYSERIFELNRGSVLLFDKRLIHKSGKNTSTVPRMTIIAHYMSADSPGFFSNIQPPKKVSNPYATA
jgi:hypothetical protein